MDKFSKYIEELLYYKNGLLSIKEYLSIVSNDKIVWVKFLDDNSFKIKTNTGSEFYFKVYKMEKE